LNVSNRQKKTAKMVRTAQNSSVCHRGRLSYRTTGTHFLKINWPVFWSETKKSLKFKKGVFMTEKNVAELERLEAMAEPFVMMPENAGAITVSKRFSFAPKEKITLFLLQALLFSKRLGSRQTAFSALEIGNAIGLPHVLTGRELAVLLREKIVVRKQEIHYEINPDSVPIFLSGLRLKYSSESGI